MSEKTHIIGLQDLLDEVSRDLDDFRRKHPNDYSLKAVTLFWELESERLLVRHQDAAVARGRDRGGRGWRFLAGCVVAFALGAIVTLLAT
jgi:hypothetical protein